MKKLTIVLLVMIFSAFAALAQTDVNKIVEKARSLDAGDQTAEAVADFSKILEANLNFDKSSVYIERGDVYYFSQKYAEAVADYEAAAKQNESVREFMEKRISLAKQKSAELNRPK